MRAPAGRAGGRMKSPAGPRVVEADGLRKAFGTFVAVDGVSFHVGRGELFGILGPNGAGKTSAVRMVYGFSPKTAGSLKIFGLDIETSWREIRSRIGVCQQENNLDPDLSVRQNLEVFARYFNIPAGVARERIGKLLEFIGLDHRREADVGELSGGLMRRLIIARTLLNNPELLIMDEPTTGLDPQSRHQVWERLEQLKKAGMSILLTTHYMEEAARLCDRLIILDRGRVLVEGVPRELVRQYVGRHVVETDEVCDGLRTYVASRGLESEDLGHRMVIYCREEEALYREISERFCPDSCVLRMGTLEDVFLKLTGRDLRE
jgi:lipooligosaccharide transport system ATP-binding protein